MRAVRIHDYKQPLVLEDVPVPDIAPDEVLLKVKAAGMSHRYAIGRRVLREIRTLHLPSNSRPRDRR